MSYRIYPVNGTELTHDGYAVTVNGVAVTLDAARVSAVPFNRRWPGHQRGLEQTELINFLSLAMDEPVSFEITPKKPFEQVVIRPLSLGIVPEIREGKICFTLEKPAYFTVEPYGRQDALHIFADPMASEAPEGEVLYFGPGVHEAGWIELKSNQTLFIDEGAVVYANVRATDAQNIKIVGRGILDNSHSVEEILYEYNAEGNDVAINNANREHFIEFNYCDNITIEGVTLRDSQVYNIRPVACKNLHIFNVKIIGCWRYNSDGIDMHNCEDVVIENCFLRTFDDSICVKGFDCYYKGDVEQAVQEAMHHNGRVYDVFRNVLVRNCVIWNDWGKALEIGAETRAEEIRDVVFEDCDIIHVSGPVLDCCNVDYADVHDVIYRNIAVEFDETIPRMVIQNRDDEVYRNPDPDYAPPLVSVITQYHHEYSGGGSRRGINRDILFENIHLTGRQAPSFKFLGCDEAHKSREIRVRGIFWNGKPLPHPDEAHWQCGEFTENIRFEE